MQSPLLTGPMSRAMRERVWRLVDEVEIASRHAENAPPDSATEEHVAAFAALAETVWLAVMELDESVGRLRDGAGRLREHAR